MQDLNDNSRTATLETTCLLPKVTTKRHRPYTSTPPQPQGPTPTRAWSPLESSPSKPSCPTSEEASGEPHVLFDNAMQSFSSSSCSGTSSVIAEDLNAVETPAGRTITSERELKRSLPASGCVRKFMLDLIPELILQNSGSVARDHLASERTFLAYVRTSVTIASAGIALVQLFTVSAASSPRGDIPSLSSQNIQSYARPVGVSTIFLGLAVLVIGLIRYFSIQKALVQGFFPAARTVVIGIAMTLIVLVVVTFAILISGRLGFGVRPREANRFASGFIFIVTHPNFESQERWRTADPPRFTSVVHSRGAFIPDLTRKVSRFFEAPPIPSPPPTLAPPPSPDSPQMTERPINVHGGQLATPDRTSDFGIFLENLSSRPTCGTMPNSVVNAGSVAPLPSKWHSSEMLGSKAVPFIRRFKPALTLKNQGSVARDHLASERTFLAYVRTSLAMASAGVALAQLLMISTHAAGSDTSSTPSSNKIQLYARPLGATTLAVALIVLIIGITRYFTIQVALMKGKFPVARLTVTGITVVLAALVAIVFGALVKR